MASLPGSCAPLPLRPFGIERFFAKHEFSVRLHLSCSDCETVPVARLLELAEADEELRALWAGLDCGYTESLGLPQLRDEIRRAYAATVRENHRVYGDGRGPEVFTVVPIEGISMVMMALLEAGDTVVCMQPCYQVLSEVARSRGCRVREWRARWREEAGFYFDVDECEGFFAQSLAEHGVAPKMLVLNTPHNPTGADFYGDSGERVRRLVALCQKHGTVLFSDEMYGRILRDREDAEGNTVFPSFAGLPNTVVLGGLSKPQGLPGLRTGWLVVEDPEVCEKLVMQKDYSTICAAGPSEVLALVALRNEASLLERNRVLCSRNMALLHGFCAKFPEWLLAPGYRVSPDTGGMATDEEARCTVFLRLGPRALERFGGAGSSARWSETLIKEQELCLAPANQFYDPDGEPEFEGFRIGLGRESFPEALAALEKGIRACEG